MMAWKFILGALVGKQFLGLGCSDEEQGANSTWGRVKSGDTLTDIAAQHNTTVQALLAANTSIEDPDMIHAGQMLTMPSGGKGADCCSEEDLPPEIKKAAEAAGGLGALREQVEAYCALYTAADGDTLASIADGLGACPQLVTKMNPQVQDPAVPLVEGTQVVVPSAKALEEGMGCAGSASEEEGMGGILSWLWNLFF